MATPAIGRPTVLYSPRWEDLPDREDRCPKCLHWWVTHGSEPDPAGCGSMESSMAERRAMAEEDRRLQDEGVPPDSAGARASSVLSHCGLRQAPGPGAG